MAKGAPDWFNPIALYGTYDTTLKPVLVDEAGRLFAMLRGLFGTTPKDLQVDTNGNVQINVKAQDLAEVINRPKYGAAGWAQFSDDVAASTTTTLVTISGKGILYGGWVKCSHTETQKGSGVIIAVDGNDYDEHTFEQMNDWNIRGNRKGAPRLFAYDEVNYLYVVEYSPGITFETSLSLKFSEAYGRTPHVNGELGYALI